MDNSSEIKSPVKEVVVGLCFGSLVGLHLKGVLPALRARGLGGGGCLLSLGLGKPCGETVPSRVNKTPDIKASDNKV